MGWGVNAEPVIKVAKTGKLRARGVYGEGIENYMNDAPVDIGIQSNSGQPAPPDRRQGAAAVFGMVAYYDFNWSDKFSTAIGYSRLDIDNSNGQEPRPSRTASTPGRTCSSTRSRTS